MSILKLMKNRVSTTQGEMSPIVSTDDIKVAFSALTAVPVHGKAKPYHFVVFTEDKADAGRDVIRMLKGDKLNEESFVKHFGGVGAFIFIFCKKIEGKIPHYEQEWATACGVYSLQLSLQEMGYGVKWNSIYKDTKCVSPLREMCLMSSEYTPMGYVMVGKASLEYKDREDFKPYVNFM